MNKNKKFRMSINAHKRLNKHHKRIYEENGDNQSFIKMNYHSHIILRQERAKRIFTKDERKRVYNQVVCDFF